jgi:hypothetical protein
MSAPIVVTHVAKASPLHKLDYEARRDAGDESGLVVGYGRTEEEAINDLILQLGEVPAMSEVVTFPAGTPAPATLVGAIAAVMNEVHTVAKRGDNKFHGYRYARMEDILQEITPG